MVAEVLAEAALAAVDRRAEEMASTGTVSRTCQMSSVNRAMIRVAKREHRRIGK